MTLIDTNVISELMRVRPEEKIRRWLDRRPRGEIGITAVTVAELLYGIGSLPQGVRQTRLLEVAGEVFDEYFGDRIFAFDHRAAVEYARIVIRREHMGAPISMADAQIAAICLANRADLATRNTRDFENTGVVALNPWIAS